MAKPTTEDALVISESVRWLEDARQVPALVRAIQRHFVQPNLLGEMSPAVLGAGIAEPVDDTTPIRDCILGTDIYGTAHTVGQTSVELSPDPDLGVIDTLFFGTTTSDNVGYHGPVTIYSSSTTEPGRPQTALDRRRRPVVVPGRLQRRDRGPDLRHPVEQGPRDGRADGLETGRKAAGRGRVHRLAPCRSSGSTSGSTSRRPKRSIAPTRRTSTSSIARSPSENSSRKMLRFSTTEQAICVVGVAGRRREAGGARRAAPGGRKGPKCRCGSTNR